jgi:outer membrane protein TolC
MGSLHHTGKAAAMRSPHRDANADDRRHGSRPWSVAVPIVLVLTAGCATQPAPRLIDGEQVLKELRGQEPSASAPAAGPSARVLDGPAPPATANATSRAPVGPTPSEARPLRVAIASARDVSTLRAAVARPTADPNVKRAAEREQVPVDLVTPPPSGLYPIDLVTSLRLADMVNPTINRARSEVLEALALQLAARTLLVPSLNYGASYHGHNGPLQRPSGRIVENSLQSLFVGAGGYMEVTGSPRIPGVNILTPLTDAIFEPLAAHQRVIASRFSVGATENDILVDVAVLHLELIRHYTTLETHRLSEIQAYQIVQAVEQYAITGYGRKSDFDRARAEWRYRRADVIDAEQGLGIAAARLAQRLNLDPSVRLQPAGGPLSLINLVSLQTPVEELIQVALEQRPDLAARTAQINQAEAHVKQEIGRPLLPTLWLGFSGGVFGGGSNLTPPLLGRFAGRSDFDVRLYWTFLNMGYGNLALIKQRKAEMGQSVAARARTINRAREEVAQALAEAKASLNQVGIARRELKSAHEGFHEDLERSRQNFGRPIEVINSLNLLAAARANLIDAIVKYDQAQFRLWVALGTPPPLVETSSPDEPAVPEYLVP